MIKNVLTVKLSTDLNSPSSIPYFLWDEPLTIVKLKRRLVSASREEQARLLAKILREARDTDVWNFTTPQEVWRRWDDTRADARTAGVLEVFVFVLGTGKSAWIELDSAICGRKARRRAIFETRNLCEDLSLSYGN